MKSLCFALLITLFSLFQASAAAQPITPIPPPDDPLVTRLPGIMALPTSDGLILLDTMDGTTSTIQGQYGTLLSPDRRMLLGQTQDGLVLSTFEETLRTPTTRLLSHNNGDVQLISAFGWSGDGQRIMLLQRNGSQLQLGIMDIQTGHTSVVLDIDPITPMDSLFYVPPDYVDMTLNTIRFVQWNPIYPDWIFLQVIGQGKHATIGDDRSWIDAGMYNFQTREYLSVSTLFPQTVISTTDWSPDGTKIAMNTMTGVSVIRFTLNNGTPRLQLLADGVDSRGQAVFRWLGAGDLLVSGNTIPYRTSHIAQPINGYWSSQEFFALSSFREAPNSLPYFRFTGTPEQEATLSCMFWDEVYPPRLTPGQRGRVTFTDGTPSRLRADHSTNAPVVTQMPEGTTFDITGPAYCVDNYRWWPLRLDNGTVGWAAEGTASEAWLEPAP